jgi:uncharacterized protein (TIGR02246 family)
MKKIAMILPAYILTLASIVAAQDATDAPEATDASETTEASDAAAVDVPVDSDEAAIRVAIESYVAAFNQADAAALAKHWTENGQFVTPAGVTLQGHQQLEDDFSAFFQENENAKLELIDTKIELVSPSVALETGLARLIAPDQEPKETDYRAFHVKTVEGWKIDSVREQDRPVAAPSHYEQLKDLEWMVGQWIDADGGSTVTTNGRWTKNQNFITRSFKVFVSDRVDFEGTQVIGWDPHRQTIRSWLFDSDGGFAAGRWTGSGQRWTVQTLSVLPDGRRASATNIYELIDSDTIRFQSIGRQVDGELLPNIEPVTIVRDAGSDS